MSIIAYRRARAQGSLALGADGRWYAAADVQALGAAPACALASLPYGRHHRQGDGLTF